MPHRQLDRSLLGRLANCLPARWCPTPAPVAPKDFRTVAQATLPGFLWNYLEGAAGDRQSFDNNRQALNEVTLRARVLAGLEDVNTSINLLGRDWSLPIACAPIGAAGMYGWRGERQGARACESVGIPFTLSTVGVCPIEEVSEAIGGAPFWFQLYVIRDSGARKALLDKAKESGCDTLIFTVDMPVPGKRYDDLYPGGLADSGAFANARRVMQAVRRPHWAFNVGLCGRPHHLGNVVPFLNKGETGLQDFFKWMSANFDPRIDWQVLEEIREQWPGKLVLKGIMDAEDATKAMDYGIDGFIVSNHGGRQIEGCPGTAAVLPAIARAAKSKNAATSILVDGGIRSGTDIFRMLALGADAVMVGRPWIYALAAGGQPAIERWFAMTKAELETQMVLAGVSSCSDISEQHLAPRAT